MLRAQYDNLTAPNNLPAHSKLVRICEIHYQLLGRGRRRGRGICSATICHRRPFLTSHRMAISNSMNCQLTISKPSHASSCQLSLNPTLDSTANSSIHYRHQQHIRHVFCFRNGHTSISEYMIYDVCVCVLSDNIYTYCSKHRVDFIIYKAVHIRLSHV